MGKKGKNIDAPAMENIFSPKLELNPVIKYFKVLAKVLRP